MEFLGLCFHIVVVLVNCISLMMVCDLCLFCVIEQYNVVISALPAADVIHSLTVCLKLAVEGTL